MKGIGDLKSASTSDMEMQSFQFGLSKKEAVGRTMKEEEGEKNEEGIGDKRKENNQ